MCSTIETMGCFQCSPAKRYVAYPFHLRVCCANVYHKFSKVLSLEQSDKGIGSMFETIHNILAVFDLSGSEPFRHLPLKIVEMRTVIFNIMNPASVRDASGSPHHLRGAISSLRSLTVVVMCDQTAEGNSRARIKEGRTARTPLPDVFKIDIDTFGQACASRSFIAGSRWSMQASKPKSSTADRHFLSPPAIPHMASFKLCNLADYGSNRAGSRCNDYVSLLLAYQSPVSPYRL